MAKFIEITTDRNTPVTLNIEHIAAIHPDEQKHTSIKLATPYNSLGFTVRQPYEEFIKWFNQQVSA